MRRSNTRSDNGHESKFGLAIAFVAALSTIIFVGLTPQKAHAAGGTVDDTTCGPTFGGNWNANACTITTGFTVGVGETLTIPSGVALFVATNGFFSHDTGIDNRGSIIVSGTLNVQNTGNGKGIYNTGTITNMASGILVVQNSGHTGIYNEELGSISNSGILNVLNEGSGTLVGIENVGTFENTASGLMTVANSNQFGFRIGTGILNPGIFTNHGALTVANSAGAGMVLFQGVSEGVVLVGTLDNAATGTLTVENSAGTGIHSNGLIKNAGELSIQNTEGTGVQNSGLSAVENSASGTITVANSGGNGIDNIGTISNSGMLDIQNTGTFGVRNLSLDGMMENDGTIQINSNADLSNSGTINNAASGVIINYGTFENGAGGSIDNDGSITTHSGGQINNAGTIDNVSGSIIVKCLGVYTGNPPVGNAVVIQPCPNTQLTDAVDGKHKSISNGGKTTSTTIEFFFVGIDNSGVSKFECNLDGGGWQVCTSPREYEDLQIGMTHVFQVRAYDSAGNVDQTPATFTWQISGPKPK